jgi:hypothetical protein
LVAYCADCGSYGYGVCRSMWMISSSPPFAET